MGDNTWFWHADHDDCSSSQVKSDQCSDKHGLQVDGESVTVYGLKVEHMYENLVQWNGNNGSVFFFQSELPYHAPSFGSSGYTGYYVDPRVTLHRGVALGVYIVFDQMQNVTAFRVPPGLDLENILGWCITGSTSQFANLVCVGSQCYTGDCSNRKCRMANLPRTAMMA